MDLLTKTQQQALESFYHQTLIANTRRLFDLKPLLKRLNEKKVPVVLLQGVALLPQIYPDIGLRPMGDIDLWVSSDFNMPHLARQAGVSPDQLELAYAFYRVGNYIAFSKATSPHLIRLWQTVLDEMKSDGSYQEICRRYNYMPQ